MNICMNEEICTNVCASMDGVRHCGVAYHTLCSSLMIFNVLLLLPHLPEMSGLTSRAGERGRRGQGQRQQQHKCHALAAHERHRSQKGNA